MTDNILYCKDIYNNPYTGAYSPIISNIDTVVSECKHIYLISQFYIDSSIERYIEIVTCLKRNIRIGKFKHIYLINERRYTAAEMQLSAEEMEQVTQIVYDGGARMTYAHACRLVAEEGLHGYIVISNSDIFFDDTLDNLLSTSLMHRRACYALLRFEYNGENDLNTCKLWGPVNDSQDTWIYHTRFSPSEKFVENVNFMLGKLGCDNVVAYRLFEDGYVLYNEPYVIRTYHYHMKRNPPKDSDVIPVPYMRVHPNLESPPCK
jgi:hypothetical protein